MSTIPKHERPAQRKAKKPQQPPAENITKVVVAGPDANDFHSPSMQHDINYVKGLSDVEASLDWIAKGIARLTSDDDSVGVSLGQNRYSGPVKLTLADNDDDDAMDRFVSAVERIADSLAKLAGLSRPRLERWHEQDEYDPRYKDTACDGGAPGPKSAQSAPDAVIANKEV